MFTPSSAPLWLSSQSSTFTQNPPTHLGSCLLSSGIFLPRNIDMPRRNQTTPTTWNISPKCSCKKYFLLGAVGALNDCWAVGTFNSPNPFSYNSPILEESTRDCEHIFQLLTFLPYINDTWKCVDYKYSFLMVAPEEVSIGTQTFGHLYPAAEISTGFSKRTLRVRRFDGPNYKGKEAPCARLAAKPGFIQLCF